MSDETREDGRERPGATKKRGGGWPKGKPRKVTAGSASEAELAPVQRVSAKAASMLSKMKSRPNWDDDTITTVGDEGVDRLKIPDEILVQLAADGVALQWITRSVRGMDTPLEVSRYTKGGWTPVYQSDFDGLLDGLFMPKGVDDVIGVDDAMLVARPLAIHRRARQRERSLAIEPLQIKEQQLGHGIPVTGGDHPTATRQNRINKTVERVEIPE